MMCDQIRELLPEHLLGTLEGPEDLEVRQQLLLPGEKSSVEVGELGSVHHD